MNKGIILKKIKNFVAGKKRNHVQNITSVFFTGSSSSDRYAAFTTPKVRSESVGKTLIFFRKYLDVKLCLSL